MNILSRQRTLAMMTGFERYTKKTKRALFLEEMEQVVPWRELCALLEPHYPKPGNGRTPVGVERMLRIYFLQQWFNLSDGLAGDAAVRGGRFGAGAGTGRNQGVQVSAFAGRTSTWGKDSGHGQSALASPGSAHHHRHDRGRNHPARAHVDQEPGAAARSGDAPDQESNQWFFGMKAHVGVDSKTKVIHTAVATPAHVADSRVLPDLLHGEETRMGGPGL